MATSIFVVTVVVGVTKPRNVPHSALCHLPCPQIRAAWCFTTAMPHWYLYNHRQVMLGVGRACCYYNTRILHR
eukprot:1628319-Pleurochrysis_carterae.AAC.2